MRGLYFKVFQKKKKKNGFLIHLNGLFRFDRKLIFSTSAEKGRRIRIKTDFYGFLEKSCYGGIKTDLTLEKIKLLTMKANIFEIGSGEDEIL